MDVALQIPAFDEGQEMVPTLESITDQRVPEYVHRISYEAWVTPSDGQTLAAAESVDAFDVFEAGEGKLTARNEAHDSAVERGFDVIATWDADNPPRSDDTLENLLEPFRDPSVSAVNGNPVSQWHLWGTLENLARPVHRAVANHIHGQLSAFTADAWAHAGPFDTTIDQTELQTVWSEEEKDFAARLREHGEMVHATGATVVNDSRRTKCRFQRIGHRFGRTPDSWCLERGEKTFCPDGNCR